eukprot:15452324-Alexandrium_andersonii.AAC.1
MRRPCVWFRVCRLSMWFSGRAPKTFVTIDMCDSIIQGLPVPQRLHHSNVLHTFIFPETPIVAKSAEPAK